MALATRLRTCLARLPVGLIAALLLGGAVAFYSLAMPGAVLARLIEASGIPRLLAIGAPPYGPPARALLAFVVGSLSFLIVWAGFALADRAPAPAGEALRPEPAVPPAPPRPMLAMAAVHDILELTDPLPPLAPAPAPPLSAARARPSPDDPIPVLMARLEAGLARRAARQCPATPGVEGDPAIWPDSRVRAALDQLRQLAREH